MMVKKEAKFWVATAGASTLFQIWDCSPLRRSGERYHQTTRWVATCPGNHGRTLTHSGGQTLSRQPHWHCPTSRFCLHLCLQANSTGSSTGHYSVRSALCKADEVALTHQGQLYLLHVLDYPEIHVVGFGTSYRVAIDSRFFQERHEQQLEHGCMSLEELLARVELKSPH